MKRGDQVTLKTGQVVKVNSVDNNRRVFDYLNEDGETKEVSMDEIAN